MWGFHVGYMYGPMPLLYVSLPHLFVKERRALVTIIIIALYLCTCLGDASVHEETLGERSLVGNEMLGFMRKS